MFRKTIIASYISHYLADSTQHYYEKEEFDAVYSLSIQGIVFNKANQEKNLLGLEHILKGL